jgi:hypothetical protein
MSLSDRDRRLLSHRVETSMHALVSMTEAQRATLRTLTQDSGWTRARVSMGGLGLSSEWLLVDFDGGQETPGGYTVGVGPEGDAHS